MFKTLNTKYSIPNTKKGFTVLEILIVIIIIVIVVGIVLASFSSLNSNEALTTETDTVLSIIERARIKSVASDGDSEYGIHFASTTVVLFLSKNYTAGSSTNETENFNSKVKIKSINLSGGVSDIYFNRISGKPSASGTIVFSLASSSSTTKTITIYNTGLSDAK